ncbi:MAG: SRPBCC family protein [Myxococcota bacterium]|nr:SRPBCC family protein [Myxococcota bacterium]
MNKWIAMGLAVGGLVLVAFAVAWNAGNAIPEDHEMRFTVASQQGPAAVWAVVSDLEGQPAWRKDLEAVEQIEDIAGKPAWREDTTAGSSTTMVTAMWSPPHSLRRDIVSDGYLMGSWRIDLVPEGMGTRISLVERGHTPNPIARLINARVGGVGSEGQTYLRFLADHLGDAKNKVVAVDSVPAE